jgi:hypothetical protein
VTRYIHTSYIHTYIHTYYHYYDGGYVDSVTVHLWQCRAHCADNPSAVVLKNGSIALMIHDKASWTGLSIAIAPTWKGPYHVMVPDRDITTCEKCLECVRCRGYQPGYISTPTL